MLKKFKPKKTEMENSSQKSNGLKNAIRSFVSSPTFNVIALVILLLSVVFGLRAFRNGQTLGAQIKFVEHSQFDAPETETGENRIYTTPEIFKGEVYDTSIRLRETGALGMAISLAVFAHHAEQGSVPPNLEKIWSILTERNLMPPGFEFQNGELLSPSGTILVRYQSEPLRFEILSRPKQDSASPAILLRFPLNSLDGRTITYFQSASVNRFDIPAPEPFAALDNLIAGGWTLERWRGELVQNDKNSAQVLAEEKRLLNEFSNNR